MIWRVVTFISFLLLCAAPANAQKTAAELNSEILTQFPDNHVGAITPSALRGTTLDMVNSIMPTAPVVSGNFPSFNGTTGLLKDSGISLNYVTNFGAKCDGATDDTAALQAWLNSLTVETLGVLPNGTCNFSSALSVNQQAISIIGAGPYTSVLQYTGATTTIDLLTVGNGSGSSGLKAGIFLSGFKIISATAMTSGAAIHFKGIVRSQLMNMVADGQDGNGNLWNGFWFDQVDLMRVMGFEARAKNDAIRVNGGVGTSAKADLILEQGKISLSGVGLHIGGAFGGLAVETTDIIANNTNVRIDTALAAEGNRELFFGSTAVIDSAASGDNINVNDTLASGGHIAIDGWVATATGSGINIVSWPNGNISIGAGAIFNHTGDGIKVQDATAVINVGSQTQISGNAGFGINATVSTTNIYASPQNAYSNTSGSFSANAHVGGTWTPTIAFGGASSGITYSFQGGQYYTYGNIVIATFNIVLTSKGVSTGGATIGGLPLTVSNSGQAPGAGGNAAVYYLNFSGLGGAILMEAGPTTTAINLYQSGSTGISQVLDSNLTNTSQIQGTVLYVR